MPVSLVAKSFETDYNKTMSFLPFGGINPQAYVYLWVAALLAVALFSVVLVYHWWRYVVNRSVAVGVTLVYFLGLTILISLSFFALYGVIK